MMSSERVLEESDEVNPRIRTTRPNTTLEFVAKGFEALKTLEEVTQQMPRRGRHEVEHHFQ